MQKVILFVVQARGLQAYCKGFWPWRFHGNFCFDSTPFWGGGVQVIFPNFQEIWCRNNILILRLIHIIVTIPELLRKSNAFSLASFLVYFNAFLNLGHNGRGSKEESARQCKPGGCK